VSAFARCGTGMGYAFIGPDAGYPVKLSAPPREGQFVVLMSYRKGDHGAMEPRDQFHNLHRYRRYRVIGLLPAVITLAGGLYPGVTDRSWIPFLPGVLLLLVCSLMIASDRKENASKKTKT
jgi:hypothetical protein